MRQWARHLASQDPRFHAVELVTPGGSVTTRCNGRWPERDGVEEHDDPPIDERCAACNRKSAIADRFDVGGDA